MNDIRELLHNAAPRPSRELDVRAVAERARRRAERRSVLGVSLIGLLLLIAAGGGAVLIGNTNGRRVQIAAGLGSNTEAGVSVTLPPGWQELPRTARTAPAEVLVVGTAPRPAGDPIQACVEGNALPGTHAGFLTLYEYRTDDPLVAPSGEAEYTRASFLPRPTDLQLLHPMVTSDCPIPTHLTNEPTTVIDPPASASGSAESTSTSAPVPASTTIEGPAPTTVTQASGALAINHVREIAFSEGERLFVARIVSVDDTSEDLLTQAFIALNSLVFQVPAVTATTTDGGESADKEMAEDKAGPDEAAAKQAVTDAINAAFATPSPVPIAISVEGGYPFTNPADREAAAETAQHSDPLTRRGYEAAQEGKFVARINWIVFDSPTYARLNFDMFVDGQQMTATTTGYAVFEDGNWRLGRATFCEMVARGGVHCPG
jgi:hypothetical protein